MYVAQFNLSHHPFARTPGEDPADSSPTLAAAFREMRRALAANRGAISLTAPVGCGKTLLLRKLQAAAMPPRKRLLPLTHAWLAQPQRLDALHAALSPSQWAQLPDDQAQLLNLRHFLKGPQAKSHRLIVVVDNAHLLPPDQLRRLLMLSMIRAGGRQPCRVLLAGSAELEPLIARLAPEDTERDKFDWASLSFAPMSAGETSAYIEHRFAAALMAPVETDSITLKPDAAKAMAAYSCGTLRTVHHLGHACLSLARQQQTQVLDVPLVTEASRQLQLNRLPLQQSQSSQSALSLPALRPVASGANDAEIDFDIDIDIDSDSDPNVEIDIGFDFNINFDAGVDIEANNDSAPRSTKRRIVAMAIVYGSSLLFAHQLGPNSDLVINSARVALVDAPPVIPPPPALTIKTIEPSKPSMPLKLSTLSDVSAPKSQPLGTFSPPELSIKPAQNPSQTNPSQTNAVKETARDQIRQVQRKLNKLGYIAGAADGIWGRRTASAVFNFQAAKGGLVNPRIKPRLLLRQLDKALQQRR